MASLTQDLRQQWEELERTKNRSEILKGLKILAGIASELAAVLTVIIATFQAAIFLTGGLASFGIPIASGAIVKVVVKYMPRILTAYDRLDQGQRKAVLMAIRFLGLGSGVFF